MYIYLTKRGRHQHACQSTKGRAVLFCSDAAIGVFLIQAIAVISLRICGNLPLLKNLPLEVALGGCVAAEVLLIACIVRICNTSAGWLVKTDISWEVFLLNEDCFLVVRTLCYGSALFMGITASVSPSIRSNICFGVTAAIHTIPVIICIHQSIYRKTFRKWPSFVTSLSGGLLYLAVLMLPYPSKQILGFIDGEKFISTISQLATVLTGGLIVAALVGLIQAVGKSGLEQVYLSETGIIPDKLTSFKRMRLRLLTHFWFHPHGFLEICSSIYTLVLAFASISAVSVIVPLKVTENPDTTSPSLPFFLGILGVGIFCLGAAMHLNASDEGLLKAEYCYACFKAPSLHSEDICRRTARWMDYCQVVANVYCSRSGIISEDKFLHQLWKPAIQRLRSKTKTCGTQFLIDFIETYRITYQMYFITDMEKQSIDNFEITSDLVQKFVGKEEAIDHPEYRSFGSLLLYAFECLLAEGRDTWERRFLKVDLSLNEAVAILFADICDALSHRYQAQVSDCNISPLCDLCANNSGLDKNKNFVNRMEFLLSFPVTLSESITRRWGDKVFEPSCWIDFENYYYRQLFIKAGYQSDDTEILRQVYERWGRHIQPIATPGSGLNTCLKNVRTNLNHLCGNDVNYRNRSTTAMAACTQTGSSLDRVFQQSDLDRLKAIVFLIFYRAPIP